MELNSENIKKIRGLIVFAVIAVVVGMNYKGVLLVLGLVFKMALPFILGAAIAFVLNVPMRFIESHLPIKKAGIRRGVSVVLTIVAVAGILIVVLFVVAPQLFATFRIVKESIPRFFNGLGVWLEEIFANEPEIVSLINEVKVDWQQVLGDMAGFLKNGASTVLSGTISAAMSIVNGVTSFGIGFIFAIYILLQKETLTRQMKKLVRAFLPEKSADRIFQVAALTNHIFSSFLAGQCMEAVILGSMFFVVLLLLRLPYAVLIGVLIAFTALIPVFGAFIGWVVGAFLMLMVNPMDALIFSVVFFGLQQIEGNLIYPHVVGGSVGLPSIWVLAAVTIGGSAFGIVGMLVFIPFCSVLYTLLKDAVNERLEWKRAPEEPPEEKQTAESVSAELNQKTKAGPDA
ncbi:MAG: AI-2E family transporter [Lachnospiraceae bacterium]|nr:AI-2E family transporter [Lachnospiraceae bacterium]